MKHQHQKIACQYCTDPEIAEAPAWKITYSRDNGKTKVTSLTCHTHRACTEHCAEQEAHPPTSITITRIAE